MHRHGRRLERRGSRARPAGTSRPGHGEGDADGLATLAGTRAAGRAPDASGRDGDTAVADLAAIKDPGTRLVNSLDRPTFAGTRQTYARPGRIPSSTNVSFVDRADPGGLLHGPDEARGLFEDAGAPGESKKVITYCGSNIAATGPAFHLAVLGRPDVAICDGSLTERAAGPALPLEVDRQGRGDPVTPWVALSRC
ncbi:sulfurtransferase [Streptomyces sp. NPDC005774]|uniref:sulfurtransferase n=1 Tax=Streptomyces sp. NPDC005774 TaxID=3364728 RepID=UPI00369BD174